MALRVELKRNQDRAINHENSYSRSKECSSEPSFEVFNFTLANLPSRPSTIPTAKVRIEAWVLARVNAIWIFLFRNPYLINVVFYIFA